jgi:hypothetical protein
MTLLKNGKVNKKTFLFPPYFLLNLIAATILLLATSCNYFETTKVDSEDLYKQEIETISWDEVDQYPLFAVCDETANKQVQRVCFKQQLSKSILDNLAAKKMQVNAPINDTVTLELNISNTGKIKITNIVVDSITNRRLPDIAMWLQEGIEKTPTVGPALKRGIPVETSMTLPVILKNKKD